MEEGVEFAYVSSKMAFFLTLVNVWKLLTNVTNDTKSSDAAGVLNMPLVLCVNIYVDYEYLHMCVSSHVVYVDYIHTQTHV